MKTTSVPIKILTRHCEHSWTVSRSQRKLDLICIIEEYTKSLIPLLEIPMILRSSNDASKIRDVKKMLVVSYFLGPKNTPLELRSFGHEFARIEGGRHKLSVWFKASWTLVQIWVRRICRCFPAGTLLAASCSSCIHEKVQSHLPVGISVEYLGGHWSCHLKICSCERGGSRDFQTTRSSSS